jgi:histone H3/H4
MVTIKSQVKEVVKNQGVNNMAEDFHEILNQKVENMLIEACDRAKKNQRKTVMGRDI